ncbi:uncharacterized protein LOC130510043 [Raphanus sativus]|uniref:Uncharacterized protein LOC130510043 n=1 Tax=Raphanus sativus TaxID=3726 RepID=A0A9W3DG08_RAPSA|nr:uncharacterized protein LOC130510043 [Raphanus sativus]
MFQFQFEKEEDLLAVLENRPYHYSRWMVIVQRWEPTVSKDFPSMIPFWIKVQGIPIHLWAEETVEDLGSNLGLFERVVITQTSVKMRVQVNGLLPLIKSSVIEYSNGDKQLTPMGRRTEGVGAMIRENRDMMLAGPWRTGVDIAPAMRHLAEELDEKTQKRGNEAMIAGPLN